MITLDKDPSGYYVVRSESGADRFIQSDWDFPYLAEAFGWFPMLTGEDHIELIAEARDWIESHIGDTVEDPGYF